MIPGLSIVGKKVSTSDIANATKCQSFYNWMTDQESTTAIFLLENITFGFAIVNCIDGSCMCSKYSRNSGSSAPDAV
jgi:hypothetical protein